MNDRFYHEEHEGHEEETDHADHGNTLPWIAFVTYPAWNVVSSKKSQAKWGGLSAFDGEPNGDCWLPVEVDTVSALPHAWFWNALPSRRLKTVEELMDAYYQSVGHGTVFLLNQTPDTSGLIPEADTRRAAEFGAEVRKRFGASVAECRGTGKLVELDFGTKRLINRIAVGDVDLSAVVRHGDPVRDPDPATRGGGWRRHQGQRCFFPDGGNGIAAVCPLHAR